MSTSSQLAKFSSVSVSSLLVISGVLAVLYFTNAMGIRDLLSGDSGTIYSPKEKDDKKTDNEDIKQSEKPPVYLSFPTFDWVHGDIKYFEGPFSSCAKACDDATGCVGYTLHKDNGKNCWLKSALGGVAGYSNDRDTFVRFCDDKSSGYALMHADWQGNDIRYHVGPFDTCAAACNATKGCVGYALDKGRGNSCWLKSKFEGNPNKDNRFDTYVKMCAANAL